MSEGWGSPAWLPAAARRQQAHEAAQEAVAAKAAADEKSRLAEEWHQRNMALYAEQAGLRGQEVSVIDLAAGRVSGRSVGAILGEAYQASLRQDAADAVRVQRHGTGAPQATEVFFGEPRLHQARSRAGRKMFNQTRRFAEWQQRKAAADAARKALDAELDWGYVCERPESR